jgi:hypothetical protein
VVASFFTSTEQGCLLGLLHDVGEPQMNSRNALVNENAAKEPPSPTISGARRAVGYPT